MLPGLRTLGWSRFAAAAVALALSGAPQLVAAHAHGPREHACRCGKHPPGVDCGCPICHRAQDGDLGKQPPCHQAAARQRAAEEQRRDGSGLPCLKGACGMPESQQPVTRATGESFTLPEAPRLVRPERREPFRAHSASPADRAAAPEPPPPRLP
jgi:hypothetical protein